MRGVVRRPRERRRAEPPWQRRIVRELRLGSFSRWLRQGPMSSISVSVAKCGRLCDDQRTPFTAIQQISRPVRWDVNAKSLNVVWHAMIIPSV